MILEPPSTDRQTRSYQEAAHLKRNWRTVKSKMDHQLLQQLTGR